MEYLHGSIALSNGKTIEQPYNNIKTKFKPTRLYKPLRLRLDKSKKYISYDTIYSYLNFYDLPPLKDMLLKIPEHIMEVCFEFGVEVVIVNQKDIFDKVIHFRQKRIRIQPENFYDYESIGFYEPGARLVGIYNKYINIKDYNPLLYFMSKGYQHAILSNPTLLEIPEYHISYNNRFKPFFVIRYALRKSNEYFPYSVEKFGSEERWKELKEDDRPMFRFLEILLGKHQSTIDKELSTGIPYILPN